mmetsp:Transcript_6583/g.18375  ORF Transcript_6583/g.18375 Transcript_6583/m.18375 type:complete len:83 (-) Transcript_6583:2184-2432(-)
MCLSQRSTFRSSIRALFTFYTYYWYGVQNCFSLHDSSNCVGGSHCWKNEALASVKEGVLSKVRGNAGEVAHSCAERHILGIP